MFKGERVHAHVCVFMYIWKGVKHLRRSHDKWEWLAMGSFQQSVSDNIYCIHTFVCLKALAVSYSYVRYITNIYKSKEVHLPPRGDIIDCDKRSTGTK